jgi:hypothetical protein
MDLKPGDRVVYVGKHPKYKQSSRIGWEGNVDFTNHGQVWVVWDKLKSATAHYPENVERLIQPIEYNDNEWI